jgi:hypothetical protein
MLDRSGAGAKSTCCRPDRVVGDTLSGSATRSLAMTRDSLSLTTGTIPGREGDIRIAARLGVRRRSRLQAGKALRARIVRSPSREHINRDLPVGVRKAATRRRVR